MERKVEKAASQSSPEKDHLIAREKLLYALKIICHVCVYAIFRIVSKASATLGHTHIEEKENLTMPRAYVNYSSCFRFHTNTH